MNDLASLIEAKSGSSPLILDPNTLRARLGYDLGGMRANGYDASVVKEHEAFNSGLEDFITHRHFGTYLERLTPREVFFASGVRVLPIDAIQREIQELAPGALLFRFGYMPFATSITGNAMCFHAPSNGVVWANHDAFGKEAITYKDKSGGYRTVPFTLESIQNAVTPLSDDFMDFLSELLNDQLESRLDKLD
jgi:hypothetical protein